MALFAACTTSFSALSFALKERVFRQVKGLHVLVAAAVVNTQCLLISVPVAPLSQSAHAVFTTEERISILREIYSLCNENTHF